jgi:protein-tyrosine phosphatase
MIDLHAHVLWGVDDGPDFLDESMAMLAVAAQSGTSVLVATPHVNSRHKYDPELYNSRVRELQVLAPEGPRILLGAEVQLTRSQADAVIRDPYQYTIAGSGYVLVEIRENVHAAEIDAMLMRFVEIGLTPIVAHPERLASLSRFLRQLQNWLDAGCLVQVTAQSLTGGFGAAVENAAWGLVDRGLVHFVASDCHDPQVRTPSMTAAAKLISLKCGADAARRLLERNAACVIAGLPLPVEVSCGPPALARSWRRLWN